MTDYFKLYKVTMVSLSGGTIDVYTIARDMDTAVTNALRKIRQMEYAYDDHAERVEVIADELNKVALLTNQ